ncbi:DUF3152 domain-containing protein [Knoellia sp. CPCC 206450]|uniref:DUF3152 domain-containing protein n=1 Tax=Knoellia tibetensis TaxID=3404798 RepID=UPI003B437FAF
MPDDIDLPDWVSEPPASAAPHEDSAPTRRADLRRASEEQRRSAARRAARHDSSRHDGRAPGRAEQHQGRPDHQEPAPPTRADRRRTVHDGVRRTAPERRETHIEMVPGETVGETRRGARRGAPAQGRRRRASTRTIARRRGVAALGVSSVVALALWTLWPSEESSSPARQTADLTASVARSGSDPVPAAEELPPSPPPAAPSGGTPVPKAGSGKRVPVALPGIAAPTVNPNRTIRVAFEVEEGSGVDPQEAATIVSQTLGDARGWQTKDRVRFRAVDADAVSRGDVDITIVLASPTMTDELCKPLRTNGQVSCFNLRRVVLNTARWTLGVAGYEGALPAYRQYMVNHEIGHGLYHGHVECTGAGDVAPIMLQQSKGLDGCRPNAWPTLP